MPVFSYFFGYRYKMLCFVIMSIHRNFYPCHLLITLALCTSNLKCCNWSICIGKSITSFHYFFIAKLAWLILFCAFSVVSLVYTQVITWDTYCFHSKLQLMFLNCWVIVSTLWICMIVWSFWATSSFQYHFFIA